MLPNGTPGALLYATKGRENKSFWRYAFSTTPTLAPAVPVGWTSLGDMDVVATKHSALTYDTAASTHGSRVYALYGDNYARFRGYNPTQGTWEGLSLPWNNTGDGVSLAARTIAGASDLIYALRGAHQDDFRVYDISENGWDRRSNFPWDVGAGGCMAYCPSDARLYALRGWGYNHFASYQTIGDDGGGPQGVPGNASTGSCLTVNALGGNRYRFVCQGLNGQRATYRIVGADGRVVWSVVSADGRAEWVANRTSTPAGVYAVLVDAGDTRASAQVSIVR